MAAIRLDARWSGYARNGRLAAGAAVSPEPLILVHDDAQPDSGAAKALQKCLRANPSAGIVCGRLIDSSGSTLHAGYSFDSEEPWGFVDRLRGRPKTNLEVLRETRVVAGSSGLMLITPAVLEATGGYDPDLAYEPADVDLCLRAAAAGFSTFYCARAFATIAAADTPDSPADARAETLAQLDAWDGLYEKWSGQDVFSAGELAGLRGFAEEWAKHVFLPLGRTRETV